MQTAGKKQTVTISRSEYERLLTASGSMPALPLPDERGYMPAIEFARASIAREVIRRRLEAGLSQHDLAERAGVRRETISRIESGKHTVTARIIDKIDDALAGGRKARIQLLKNNPKLTGVSKSRLNRKRSRRLREKPGATRIR